MKYIILTFLLIASVNSFAQIKAEEVQVVEGLQGKVIIGTSQTTTALEINGGTTINGSMGLEGTWTPTIKSGSASGWSHGSYVKIGNLVHCQFDLHISSSGTVLEIGGLPFSLGSKGESIEEIGLTLVARNSSTGAFQPYYCYIVNWGSRNYISGANPGSTLSSGIIISGQFSFYTGD